MKKLVSFVCVMVMICFVSFGQVRVSHDYDKEADFTQFSSYNFTDEALKLPINDLNRKRLIAAINNELVNKGLTESNSPDLLIDIKVTADRKQTATATTDYYGRGYRYRWGGGFSSTNIDVHDYIEGTIFIDLISTASNQLVWQGRGVGTISQDVKPEKREKRINKAVTKIFSKYPPEKLVR